MNIEQEVRQFIDDNFIVALDTPLPGDRSLTHSGIIDSLGVLELVLFIEQRYDLTVSEAETLPENLDTVDNIVRYLSSKLAQQAPNPEDYAFQQSAPL